MSKAHQYQIVVSLVLDETFLSERTPASVSRVGEELANQVVAFQRRSKLSYFPPLAYCVDHGAIDAELLEAFAGLHWLAMQLSRREVLRRMREFIIEPSLRKVSNPAYALPAVRVRDPNARSALALHLQPNRLRLELSGPARKPSEGIESLQCRVRDGLGEVFRQVEVRVHSRSSAPAGSFDEFKRTE